MRTHVAEGISVFTTGSKGQKPCVNVADLGEGQTPEAFPLTLLSLGKRNKFKVRFAQGKTVRARPARFDFAERTSCSLSSQSATRSCSTTLRFVRIIRSTRMTTAGLLRSYGAKAKA